MPGLNQFGPDGDPFASHPLAPGTTSEPFTTIYNLLQLSPITFPQASLQYAVDLATTKLQADYPCLGIIANLSGNDSKYTCLAISLLVAAKIRPYLPKSVAVGEITTIAVGTTRFAFSGKASQPLAIEDLWIDQAWDSLQLVSCVAQAWALVRSSAPMIALAGRRRSREGSGISTRQNYNPLTFILADETFDIETVGYDRWPTSGGRIWPY